MGQKSSQPQFDDEDSNENGNISELGARHRRAFLGQKLHFSAGDEIPLSYPQSAGIWSRQATTSQVRRQATFVKQPKSLELTQAPTAESEIFSINNSYTRPTFKKLTFSTDTPVCHKYIDSTSSCRSSSSTISPTSNPTVITDKAIVHTNPASKRPSSVQRFSQELQTLGQSLSATTTKTTEIYNIPHCQLSNNLPTKKVTESYSTAQLSIAQMCYPQPRNYSDSTVTYQTFPNNKIDDYNIAITYKPKINRLQEQPLQESRRFDSNKYNANSPLFHTLSPSSVINETVKSQSQNISKGLLTKSYIAGNPNIRQKTYQDFYSDSQKYHASSFDSRAVHHRQSPQYYTNRICYNTPTDQQAPLFSGYESTPKFIPQINSIALRSLSPSIVSTSSYHSSSPPKFASRSASNSPRKYIPANDLFCGQNVVEGSSFINQPMNPKFRPENFQRANTIDTVPYNWNLNQQDDRFNFLSYSPFQQFGYSFEDPLHYAPLSGNSIFNTPVKGATRMYVNKSPYLIMQSGIPTPHLFYNPHEFKKQYSEMKHLQNVKEESGLYCTEKGVIDTAESDASVSPFQIIDSAEVNVLHSAQSSEINYKGEAFITCMMDSSPSLQDLEDKSSLNKAIFSKNKLNNMIEPTSPTAEFETVSVEDVEMMSHDALQLASSYPSSIPKELYYDNDNVHIFQGQTLLSWLSSNSSHYYKSSGTKLLMFVCQICTNLMACGILRLHKASIYTESLVFKPENYYYWMHAKDNREAVNTLCMQCMQHETHSSPRHDLLEQLQAQHKLKIEKLKHDQELEIFQVKNDSIVKICQLRDNIDNLEQQIQKYRILADIESLRKGMSWQTEASTRPIHSIPQFLAASKRNNATQITRIHQHPQNFPKKTVSLEQDYYQRSVSPRQLINKDANIAIQFPDAKLRHRLLVEHCDSKDSGVSVKQYSRDLSTDINVIGETIDLKDFDIDVDDNTNDINTSKNHVLLQRCSHGYADFRGKESDTQFCTCEVQTDSKPTLLDSSIQCSLCSYCENVLIQPHS